MMRTHGSLTVYQFPCLQDNYGLAIREEQSGQVAVIDTPDAEAISAALDKAGWGLNLILNTHWHFDHTGGNEALKTKYGAKIIGPKGEGDRIPGCDRAVIDGELVALDNVPARVIETPGHTKGHICYIFDHQNVGFVGDTLFSMGCGRLFEGTPAQMWTSLTKLKTLPADMTLYCAHEYTTANGQFAASLGEENIALETRLAEVAALRADGQPTVPMTLATELETNPFLRADAPSMRQAIGMENANPTEVFAEIRRRKDSF